MSMCAGRASVPTHVCMVNDSSRAAAEQQSSRAAELQKQSSARVPKKAQANSSKFNKPTKPQERFGESGERLSKLKEARARIVEIV